MVMIPELTATYNVPALPHLWPVAALVVISAAEWHDTRRAQVPDSFALDHRPPLLLGLHPARVYATKFVSTYTHDFFYPYSYPSSIAYISFSHIRSAVCYATSGTNLWYVPTRRATAYRRVP